MRVLRLILVGIWCFSSVLSVPIINDSASNKLEYSDDVEIIEDDLTTRSLEKLSSAATCLVAGIEYTHGQQINRIDACEFCLCLDGEMFCWWQDCPPATDGPCKDQGPFSQCVNVVARKTPTSSQDQSSSSNSSTTAHAIPAKETKNNNYHSTDDDNNIPKIPSKSETSDDRHSERSHNTSSNLTSSSTPVPEFCVVMGVEYKIGEKLPHDTGNCIECICGPSAKVTCSPNQCVPLGEEINDYRPPEPRLANSDSF